MKLSEVEWSEELHTLSYVINIKLVKKIVYLLTWFLFSKFDCEVSVIYLLLFYPLLCMHERNRM